MHGHHHSEHQLLEWLPFAFVCAVWFSYVGTCRIASKRARKPSAPEMLSFSAGCILVAIAVLPGMMEWGHSSIRGHMVQHLLMAMFAPIFLVMGAPLTLLLRTLPAKASRFITRFLRSAVFSFASHPLMALVLNVGGMFALYLTPLYSISLSNPTVHYAVHVHFLAAGYLFTWSIIGFDPVPRRPPFALRVSVLACSIALHAFLTKYMYAYLLPAETGDSAGEIREAAKLMYYGGDLSELLVLVILFVMRYPNFVARPQPQTHHRRLSAS